MRASLLLLAILLAPSLAAQVSENVELLGRYDDRSTYADVWGYTTPDGREYGLVALQGLGLVIVDVTDPAPVEVGFFPRSPDTADSKDVKVYQHYAYLINEEGPIEIIDIADPTNPRQVGRIFNDSDPDTQIYGAHNVLVANDHLWITGAGSTQGALQVYSLADPENPQLVSEYGPYYYHDFEVRGDIGFAPAIYGQGVDVLDISNPADISTITTFNYTGSGAHNTCTPDDLSHIYVGDEIGSGGTWTRVFDISDVMNENVDLVTDLIVNPGIPTHNCYVKGDRLYIAHYGAGLQVYDVSNPGAPVHVGYYDTYTDSGGGYVGAWSVYPYFASGKILVSDRQSGLYVLRLTGDAVAQEEAVPTAVLSLSAAPNPTTGRTRLAFDLRRPAHATLTVHDALGREVARLADGVMTAGLHSAQFNTADLAPGVYVARLTADGATATQSVVVAR